MKIKIIKRIIANKFYYENRMDEMSRKCSYYLENGVKASNKKLHDAFIGTAVMYSRRYQYYFRKISENRIFA